ncbi:MAG: hypothetical protein ACYDEX_24450 [Mobilitalea sp.]
MDNTVGKVCKVSAIIIFTMAFISGFILSTKNGDLNISLALIVWASGFFSGLLLFALGEIVNLLYYIRCNTKETNSELIKIQSITQGSKNEIIIMQDILKQEKK